MSSAASETMDRVSLLLATAQVTFIVAGTCLNKCLNITPVISTWTYFYCCLASDTLLILGFYSPMYIPACLLNFLGEVLAIITGASQSDFPDIFYGTGYGYEDDAEAYCWYLLHWIWSDSANVVARCVLFVAVPAVILLSLRTWSWFCSTCRQRVQRTEEHRERIRAETFAIKNRLKANFGWTDEEYERAMELGAGNNEADHARLGSSKGGEGSVMEDKRMR